MSLGIGVAIHSIEKLPILEQVLKPALPGHTIDSVSPLPSHLLHFTGSSPEFPEASASAILVVFQSWENSEIDIFKF